MTIIEPFYLSIILFLAWGWLGFFYAVAWLVLSLVRQGIEKRDRTFLRGVPWDELREEERRGVNRHWRAVRWRGLKHYVAGLLLLGGAWLASVAFLGPPG